MKEFNVFVLVVAIVIAGISTASSSNGGLTMGVQGNDILLRSSEFPSDTKLMFWKTGSGQTSRPDETLSEYLWKMTFYVRKSALHTDLMQGLRAGTLNPTLFGVFNLQDAVWLEKASKSISLAAYRVQYNTTHGLPLRALLLEQAISYQGYADALYNKWHIAGPSDIQLNGGCKAYAEYEHLVAKTMDVGYPIICMTACLKLWPWIGFKFMPFRNETFGVYTDWVKENLDPDYDGYTKYDLIINDMFAQGQIDRPTALDVFKNCMEGEVAFFKYST